MTTRVRLYFGVRALVVPYPRMAVVEVWADGAPQMRATSVEGDWAEAEAEARKIVNYDCACRGATPVFLMVPGMVRREKVVMVEHLTSPFPEVPSA